MNLSALPPTGPKRRRSFTWEPALASDWVTPGRPTVRPPMRRRQLNPVALVANIEGGQFAVLFFFRSSGRRACCRGR